MKKGFTSAAKFTDGRLINNGIITVIKKTKNLTSKAPPMGQDDEGGSSGGTEPEPLREVVVNNNYKNPSDDSFYLIYNSSGNGANYGSDISGYVIHAGGGNGSGGNGNISITFTEKDPCSIAQAITDISRSPGYISVKSNIVKASADGKEHSITMGRAITNNVTQSPMNNGGTNSVQVNTTLTGAFGAMHNHPNNSPLSAGDIYASVVLNTKNSNFTTSFIVTGGETYAIVVTDLAAAKAFITKYPSDISPVYPPEFPDFIFDQISYIRSQLGESNNSRTSAIALVLDHNNAGITLFKQDSNGQFNPVKIQETTLTNGTKKYISVPC